MKIPRWLGCLAPLALLACGPTHAALREDPGARTIATLSGGAITEFDLDRQIAAKPKLARQIYEIRRDALEAMILQRLVEGEASRRKVTPEVLLEAEVQKKVAPPTEAELKRFFDERLAGSGYKFDEVHGQIVEHLQAERRKAALVAFLERLKAKAHVQILLPAPRVDVAGTGPSRGLPSAKITLIEFSDFECPFCQKQEDALRRLLAAYPTDLRLVFREFPLDLHPDAMKAAQAALCADDQGKFWPMHDALFQGQSALGVDKLKSYARAVGLDGPRFDSCLDSGKTKPRIDRDQQDGEEAGVEGTPAIFVNGRMLSGATSFEDLRQVIEDALHSPRRTGT